MKLIFGVALAGTGIIITLGIFPAAKIHLDEFIDDIMPGLGFSDTLEAYVSFLPYILLLLLIIGSFILIRR